MFGKNIGFYKLILAYLVQEYSSNLVSINE